MMRRSEEKRQSGVIATAVWLTLFIGLAAVIFLAGNYALNHALGSVDRAPIRERLAEAFRDGSLGMVESRVDDDRMGVHQTNDCLIYDMAARDPSDPVLYLFGAARTRIERASRVGNCEALRDWLVADPTERISEAWYLRYIHGYRAAAILLLRVFDVPDARAAMKASCYGVFGLVALVNALFLFGTHRRNGAAAAFASNAAGYALIGVVTPLFFGFPYFAQSISHAPEIVTLGSFVMAWSVLDFYGRLTEKTAVGLTIVYALLTAYFEFLTGYIPVGVTMICLLVAIGWSTKQDASPFAAIRVLAFALYAFIASIVAAFALNVIATALFHKDGAEVAQLFMERLMFRMSSAAESRAGMEATGRTIGNSDVGLALLQQLEHLGFTTERGGIAAFLATLIACLFCPLDLFAAGRPWRERVAILISAGSIIPIALWLLMFKNHTTIHASFMVRILVAIPLAGAVTGWLWARSTAAARAAGRSIGRAPPPRRSTPFGDQAPRPAT